MSSSDSDVSDCYSNVALKLKKMKNNYFEDNIEATNLLNDSYEIDEIVKSEKTNNTAPTTINISDFEPSCLNEEPIKTKRVTRSSARNAVLLDSPVICEIESSPDTVITSRSRRGAGRQSIQRNSRNRGRGNRHNRNGNIISTLSQIIPTYSVGNTDEYPDQSNEQQLFSNKNSDVVLINDTEIVDDNEELSVKVCWQSSEYFKFTIRKYQKLSQIFDFFSNKVNVAHDKLLFTFNERILQPSDTPDSIGYSIVKFIDGGIVKQSVTHLFTKASEVDGDSIVLKFQCQNVKKPVEIAVKLDEKFSVIMFKLAEHLEQPLEKLKFEFDGDCLTGNCTAKELELEGGECIDVKVIS